MGKWSNMFFERDKLPEICFLFAGSSKHTYVDEIKSYFDEILFHDYSHFERVIARKESKEYLLIFQVYGSSAVIDLVTVLKDGNIKQIIFFGSAFGVVNGLDVGNLVIPNKVQCLEGVISFIENEIYVYPDADFSNQIKEILASENIDYFEGKTVSVPCVSLQPSKYKFDNDLLALEMECSSLLYFANKNQIKSMSILIISDTINKKLIDSKGDHKSIMVRIFQKILINIHSNKEKHLTTAST